MSRKARCQHLLEKSVHAALSAIEIYNMTRTPFLIRKIQKKYLEKNILGTLQIS